MMRLALLAALLCACGEDAPAAPPPPPPPVAPEEPPTPIEAPTPTPEPPPPPSRIEARGPYRADVGRDCDGHPALALDTASGTCVGIVAHAETPAIAEARGASGRARW